MKPTVSRIVHLNREAPKAPLAAIVAAVNESPSGTTCELAVFHTKPDTPRLEFVSNVREGTKPGEWSWPPKV